MGLLELEALEVRTRNAVIVDELSLTLSRHRVLALVGESGSGKTVSALALCGLLPSKVSARWRALSIAGNVVAKTSELSSLRGRSIAYMPQDASGALDPVMRVGALIDEVLEHVACLTSAVERANRRHSLLSEVGFSDPRAVERLFPHQLSGGMQQRAVLAATLAADPSVLMVDEPTTALDAHLRKNVLALFRDLVVRRGLALLLITHDLAAAETIADEVIVLYAGRVAEAGKRGQILSSPRHPYTAGLMAARLGLGTFKPMPGSLPPLGERPVGCRFRSRCGRSSAKCTEQPELIAGVACHHPLETW
jgi:peptide/nickel transport system ATP-binding protein